MTKSSNRSVPSGLRICAVLVASVLLMSLCGAEEDPNYPPENTTADSVVPESEELHGHGTDSIPRKQAADGPSVTQLPEETELAQGANDAQSAVQQDARAATLARWEKDLDDQKIAAAKAELENSPSTPVPPPPEVPSLPPPPPPPAPSPPVVNPEEQKMPPSVHHDEGWKPWEVNVGADYNALSANQACNTWLKHASVTCEIVTQAAKRCTTRALAADRYQHSVGSASCLKAREDCASMLEWCRSEPGSVMCQRAGAACAKVDPTCKHTAQPNSVVRCLPAQKLRVFKCGEGYAKAYSACWHAFDATAKHPQDAEALEEEVAVQKCSRAFAQSTLSCMHHKAFFDNVAKRFQGKTQMVGHQKMQKCHDVHTKGQLACNSAWSQSNTKAQQRDAFARKTAHHTTAVFWPGVTEAPTIQAPQAFAAPVVPPPQASAAPVVSSKAHGLSRLLRATHDIQQQVAADASNNVAGMVQQPTEGFLQTQPANPHVTVKDQVHPSPFKNSSDIGGGVFAKLQSADAAEQASTQAKALQKKILRKSVLSAEKHLTPDINPAVYGAGKYKQKHPLSVAMQTCRSQQKAAAVRCLDISKSACHQIWAKSYMSCFNVFGQAKSWLQRAGRIPKPPQVKRVVAKKFPATVARSAELTCAHAYAEYSVTCREAHQQSGALCNKFATREGAGISAEASSRCGSTHSQAEGVCARAHAMGRKRCNAAWANANSVSKRLQRRGHGDQLHSTPVWQQNTPEPLDEQLKRAQLQTMARVRAAQQRLQNARRSGMVNPKDQTMLLDLHSLRGVRLALEHHVRHMQPWQSMSLLQSGASLDRRQELLQEIPKQALAGVPKYVNKMYEEDMKDLDVLTSYVDDNAKQFEKLLPKAQPAQKAPHGVPVRKKAVHKAADAKN